MVKETLAVLSIITPFAALGTVACNSFIGGSSGWFSTSVSETGTGLWHLAKIGLNEAWDVTTGYANYRVGLIDTGIDSSHTDMTGRLDTFASHSWSPNSTDPFLPIEGHGTWTAGIYGANPNNGNAVGVDWNTKIVCLRADGDSTPDHDEVWGAVVNAINYAQSNSIPYLCFAGGFETETNSDLYNAIDNYDGLLICSAGQPKYDPIGYNFSYYSLYPQVYNFDNILVVAASDNNDDIWPKSNRGASVVDLFAPGDDIRGSWVNGGYYVKDGTSASAPIVAGVATLVQSVRLGLTPAQVKQIILDTADQVSGLSSYCPYGRRVNAFEAVKAAIPVYSQLGTDYYSPNGVHVGYNDWCRFTVPAAGKYEIESFGGCPASTSLYGADIEDGPIATAAQGSGSGQNFRMIATLAAGTHYLRSVIGPTAASDFRLRVSAHAHSYDTYVWKTNTTHRAFCECGASSMQAHVVTQAAPHTCVLCGGYASTGIIPMGNGPIDGSYASGIIVLDDSEYAAHAEAGDLEEWIWGKQEEAKRCEQDL